MATVQKGSKINFYKMVSVKPVATSEVKTAGNEQETTNAIQNQTVAINNLGGTLNSFAKVLTDLKKVAIIDLEREQERNKKNFKAKFAEEKGTRKVFKGLLNAVSGVTGGFLENILGFIGELLKFYIGTKVLKWLSNPENLEKVKSILSVMMKIGKFIFDWAKFGITNTIDGLYNLLSDDTSWWQKILGFGQAVVGISAIVLGLRYLKNPTKIVTDIARAIKALIGFARGGGGRMPRGRMGRAGGVLLGGAKVLAGTVITYAVLEGVFTASAADGTLDAQRDKEGKLPGEEGYDETTKGQYKPTNVEPEQKALGGVLKKMSKGGWIDGPQSGYPVSMDGGRSTSFIGHGREYVARRSDGGAFVVPFDTPGTKTQPHLTQRRLGEGKRLGFFANGGLVGSNAEKWAHMRNLGSKAGAKYPNLVAAQFALESAWGSAISGKNNFFGIKATGNEPATVKNTREVINGKSIYVDARFKDFQTPQDAVNHLVTQWYKDYRGYSGVNNAPDVLAAADMLKTEGYATDPAYAQSLKRLVGEYSDTDVRTSNKGNFMQQFMRFFGVGGGGDEKDERGGNEGGRIVESGSNTVIGVTHPDTGSGYGIKGQTDQSGRPLTFSKPAATAFARALKDSGMNLGSFIASTGRSDAKNKSVGGHPNSHHMYGEAIDMNGAGYEWMKANGKKYGWQYVYNHGPGSAHFKYVGSGAGTTAKLGPPGQKPTVTASPTQQESASKDTGMDRSLLGSPSSSKGLSIGSGGNPASKFKSAQEKRELEKTTDERNKARREVTSRSQEMIQTALATIAQQNGVNSQAIQQAQMAVQAAMSQTPKTPMVVGTGGRAGGFGGGGSAGGGSGGGKSTASKLSSSLNTLRGILK